MGWCMPLAYVLRSAIGRGLRRTGCGHLQSFAWTPKRTFRRRLRCRQRTFSRRRVIGILISLSPEYSVSDGRSELSHAGAKRISPAAT